MSCRAGGGPSKSQYSNGLTYISNTPKFLQNFGRPKAPSPSPEPSPERELGRGGRELPSRPKEGKWAGGSDDESAPNGKGKGKGNGENEEEQEEEDDDEWGETFGGGGADGPQIVVLKEGRHLSEDEVKRLRRKAKGEPSPPPSPPLGSSNMTEPSSNNTKKPSIIPKSNSSANKRKLVGNDDSDKLKAESKAGPGEEETKKKKKKAKKGMLSFNEAEGEE